MVYIFPWAVVDKSIDCESDVKSEAKWNTRYYITLLGVLSSGAAKKYKNNNNTAHKVRAIIFLG